jgi:FKBP-type peptidyl-prolyl cis-trans isomerase FklB
MTIEKAYCVARRMALPALMVATSAALAQAPAAPVAPMAASAPAAAATDEAASYSIGIVFGNQLHASGVGSTLSIEAVMRGFRDGMAGKPPGADDTQRATDLVRAGREALAAENHATARDFLAQNARNKGVVTTASGLQNYVYDAGEAKAASPGATDRVTAKYRGCLTDGTEVDRSGEGAQAATFGLANLVKGWREGLMLMKPGAKLRLFIPPELAYDLNSPPGIPPGSLLVYDVELVRVEPPATAK